MMLLKFRKLILSFTLLLILMGSYAYYAIPKQELPDLSIPYSIVSITAPGYSSEEIDEDIIMQFKSEVLSLPDIDVVESYAFDNYGLVVIGFKIDVPNPEELNSKVREIVYDGDIKDNVTIDINNDFSVTDILYAFPEENLDEALKLEEELSKIDEVLRVEISEFSKPFIEVTVDNNKLSQYGLSLSTLQSLIESDGIDYTLGYVENNAVITSNNYSSIEEVENIIVGLNGTSLVTLKEVSTIKISKKENHFNKLNDIDVLYMSVYFSKSIDVTTMGDEIREVVSDYSDFNEISFFPDDVEESIDEITSTLLLGMAVVILVVLIGLGVRSSLIILITFPFTTLSTIFVLYILGFELQNISIAGLIISIGIIVDNAVVVIDAIKYNLELNEPMDKSIFNAIKQNSIPVLTSTLTTIVAFTPLLFLPGVAGQMAFTLPLTVIIALIFSYIVAIFTIPIISSRVLKVSKSKEINSDNKLVRKLISKPVIVVGLSLILLVSSIYTVITKQEIQLFPTAQKEYIFIDYTNNLSSNLDDMLELSDYITSNINSDTIISASNYLLPTFYTTLPSNVKSPNAGRIIYTHNGNNKSEIERINDLLVSKYGKDVTFNVFELELNQPGVPIEIILFDIDRLDEIAQKVSSLESINKVEVSIVNDVSSYVVTFNDNYLLQNNIFKAQVEEQVAKLLNEIPIDVVDNIEYSNSLVLKSNVSNIEELKSQFVKINGSDYLLNDLIEIKEELNPSYIHRYNFNESVTISTFIEKGYGIYGAHSDVLELLESEDVDYELYGEVRLTKDIFSNVLLAGIIAFAIIFLILLAQFRNFRDIIIIMSTIFLSFIGSAVALVMFSQNITFSVTLGLVSLMGIVVNNGILLLDYIRRSSKEDAISKCVEAVQLRSRAIIISNVTTISGLVPLIIFGNSFFRPMAIAMAGGMVLTVPLSLIVLPSLYVFMYKSK